MKTSLFALACFCLMLSAQSARAQLDAKEIERREAAAGFVLPQAMGLGVLRAECGATVTGDDAVERIARGWWERNRDTLDVATWVSQQAVERYRATLPADKAAQFIQNITQSLGNSVLLTLRSVFAGQLPDAARCMRAAQRYQLEMADFSNLSKTPVFSRFATFVEALNEARADKAYRPMAPEFRTFDAQVSKASVPLITMDAIEAAKGRNDGAGVVRGYEFLAGQGDGRGAQTLGIFYLNGQYVPKNLQLARAWFYNAWALGNPEGINALGVMVRDGMEMRAEPGLALAAFAMARQGAKEMKDAFQRSSSNYTRLADKMGAADVAVVGCLKWQDVHDKFRQLAEGAGVKLLPMPKLPQGTLNDTQTLGGGGREVAPCKG